MIGLVAWIISSIKYGWDIDSRTNYEYLDLDGHKLINMILFWLPMLIVLIIVLIGEKIWKK